MSPLGIVVLIVLIDLMGFTLVMPLLAPFAEEYGFRDWQIGLLFAAYPLCQLLAGPLLGRLSDRYGRRPLLVLSQAGTALSFVILGFSRDLTTMLLARMLDGASGGNILVAQAYVADVTTPEQRTRGMGLIGMAFGLGFVLGPILGGLLLGLPVAPAWRLRIPFLVAAAFSTLAWVLVLLRLPESLPAGSRSRESARVASWRGLKDTLSAPRVRRLVLLGFLAVLAFACLEGTFSLYLLRRMDWDARRAAFAFAFLGLITAAVQGGLIRKLVPRFGEVRLIVAGLAMVTLGFLSLAAAASALALGAAILMVGTGQGMLGPSVSGLLSRSAPAEEQGSVFGTFASAQTLARMVGYATSNALLGLLGTGAPYAFGAGVYVVALILTTGLAGPPDSTPEGRDEDAATLVTPGSVA